jgi:hypothetical protein
MTARKRAINDSSVNRQLTKLSRNVVVTWRSELHATLGCAAPSNPCASLGTKLSDT